MNLDITFCDSLRIQVRVISALLRRDMVTITRKQGVGFFLLMVEPFAFAIILAVVMIFRDSFANQTIPIIAFVISGVVILWACRFQTMKSMGVLSNCAPLLYHRQVKATDIVLGRALLQVFTSTLSFLIILPGSFILGIIDHPQDAFLVVISWILVQWYSFTLALIVGPVSAMYYMGMRIGIFINVIHTFITGLVYMVDWFPVEYQKWLLIFPMVNACEMMRDGLFGNICVTHYSIPYIIFCNIVLTFVGLIFCRKCSNMSSFYD